jgi:hypothetical protein
MHKEILTKKQKKLLPILKYFSEKDFYLAGGTALALQLGHRESIDFDLFTQKKFDNLEILKDLRQISKRKRNVIIDKLDEYTIIENDVKLTFLRYPFNIKDIIKKDDIKLAQDLTIGAMKAYALGRRSKWKDYVDLYILLEKYSLEDIINKSKKIFGSTFSEKMFLQQLSYFKDINYDEKVIWKIKNPPTNKKIKETLSNYSVKKL